MRTHLTFLEVHDSAQPSRGDPQETQEDPRGRREEGVGRTSKKDSTRTRIEEGRFLTELEQWSSDVSEVEEIEINSYARDSRPYSTSSYTCQFKHLVEQ
jgi:hypothetical protein